MGTKWWHWFTCSYVSQADINKAIERDYYERNYSSSLGAESREAERNATITYC
jgi:hypothetical protein